MIARIIYFVILFLGLYQRIYAQEENFRAATPASPQAQSFTRYGEIPVSLNTGVPNISIPLFTIQQYNLQHPVELRYHAGGHKVMDIGSNVGLGWNLNVGGVISRTRRGVIDEANLVGYFQVAHKLKQINFRWDDIQDPYNWFNSHRAFPAYVDIEPDVFSVSVGEYQFQFQYDINHKIVTDAPDSVKIEYLGYTFTPDARLGGEWTDYQHQYIPGWKITTPDGIQYYFEEKEITRSYPVGYDAADSTFTLSENINAVKEYSSAWYLTKIEAPTGEQILFTYDIKISSRSQVVHTDLKGIELVLEEGQSLEDTLKKISSTIDGKRYTGPDPIRYNINVNQVPFLKKITTLPRTVDITFNPSKTEYLYFNSAYSLGHITMNSFKQKFIKHIKFYHSHALNRLTLDSLYISSTPFNDIEKQWYRFRYNNRALPDPTSLEHDHWGFYNANGESEDYIPTLDWNIMGRTFTVLGANRESNPATIQAGLLTQIQYPTGGYTRFEFEPHEFVIPNTSQIYRGAGVRIKKMISTTGLGDASPMVKKFTYTRAANGTTTTSGSTSIFPTQDLYKRFVTVHSYSEVEYLTNPRGTGYIKITHYTNNFTMPPMLEFGHTAGSYIDYGQVSIIYGEQGENGKTMSRFTSSAEAPDYLQYGYPVPPLIALNYRRGQMLEQADYDAHGNLVQKVENNYAWIEKENTGLMMVRTGHTGFDFPSGRIGRRYYFNKYQMPLGYHRLVKIKTTQFDSGKQWQEVLQYAYDENIKMERAKTRFNSDGSHETTYTYYAVDQSGGTYLSMKNRFILNPLVKAVSWNRTGTGPIKVNKAVKTSYGKLTGNFLPSIEYHYYPQEITVTDSLNFPEHLFTPVSRRLRYGIYGQLEEGYKLSVEGKDYTHYSQIWSYRGQYVIAEAINANRNEIYHTSFENPGGGFEQPESSVELGDDFYPANESGKFSSNTSKTGFQSYHLYNAALTLQPNVPIAGGKDYQLSYWVTAGPNAPWQLKTKIIRNYQAGTPIQTEVINGYIDEVRLHPLDVQMITYTYEPGVGLTSKTDSNHLTTYFEYDKNNRLKTIKDHQGDIVSHYQYHIKE